MNIIDQFNQLTFGIEIETTGRGRRRVAQAIRSIVGGHIEHAGGCYDTYEVRAADGRVWKAMSDSSVNGYHTGRMAEVVSPVLRYSDLETLQEVVRAIRKAGARVDSSCGIHIHIGADAFTTKALTNLLKIAYKQEDILYAALDIESLREAWYGYRNMHPSHYDSSRYHGINLHNVFFRGTVEFRWFAATLHAGKVKAYIQLVLALACKAINARSASGKAKRAYNPTTAKYDWRVFLLGLGLKGEHFATARKHLLGNLKGDSGFKNGRTQREATVARTAEQITADEAAIAEHINTMSNL